MIKIEVPGDVKKLLFTKDKAHVEKVLKKVRDELAHQIVNKIQEDGFAPRKTGKFVKSHHITSNNKETVIKSVARASDGVPLWLYIVGGHRVLTTERSRRWWFWYLNNVLGGHYTRKTSGGAGYVPPDRYHERAINATSINTVISIIEAELLS